LEIKRLRPLHQIAWCEKNGQRAEGFENRVGHDVSKATYRFLLAPQGIEGLPLYVIALHSDILQQIVGKAEYTVQFAALLEPPDDPPCEGDGLAEEGWHLACHRIAICVTIDHACHGSLLCVSGVEFRDF
jgi:hypothetical protein